MKGIKLIACVGYNNEIGMLNGLIWYIPEDLKAFKRITTGNPVLMGRKTYESIGRPLKDRRNIIISRYMPSSYRLEVAPNLETALHEVRNDCFIIGGESLYRQALPFADFIFLTYVKDNCSCADRFFPEIPDNLYSLVAGTPDLTQNRPSFCYKVYASKSRVILSGKEKEYIRKYCCRCNKNK